MLQEAVDELFQHTLAQAVMMGRSETFCKFPSLAKYTLSITVKKIE